MFHNIINVSIERFVFILRILFADIPFIVWTATYSFNFRDRIVLLITPLSLSLLIIVCYHPLITSLLYHSNVICSEPVENCYRTNSYCIRSVSIIVWLLHIIRTVSVPNQLNIVIVRVHIVFNVIFVPLSPLIIENIVTNTVCIALLISYHLRSRELYPFRLNPVRSSPIISDHENYIRSVSIFVINVIVDPFGFLRWLSSLIPVTIFVPLQLRSRENYIRFVSIIVVDHVDFISCWSSTSITRELFPFRIDIRRWSRGFDYVSIFNVDHERTISVLLFRSDIRFVMIFVSFRFVNGIVIRSVPYDNCNRTSICTSFLINYHLGSHESDIHSDPIFVSLWYSFHSVNSIDIRSVPYISP